MEPLNTTDHFSRPNIPVTQSKLIQSVTFGHVASAIFAYILAYALISSVRKPRYPPLPWLGCEGKGWVARFFVGLRGIQYVRDWAAEGYQKYNKDGKSFILPTVPGVPDEIVIPRDQMQWMLDLSDDVLSIRHAHYEVLHGEYAFIDADLIRDPYHEHIIHRSLARNLASVIPGIEDEVVSAMDDLLGMDEVNFKSVNVWDFILAVVARASNRMLIGLPTCRDKHYLDNMIGFTNSVVANMMLLGSTPGALKPLVGRVANLWGWYHWKQTARHAIPVIERRLHDIRKKEAGDPGYRDWSPPADYITWHIKLASAENRLEELTPTRISQRLTPLNFAALHTSTLSLHGTLLDLLATDPSKHYVEDIVEECNRTWNEENRHFTREGLQRMYRTDSAIRESMRVSSFATTSVGRIVVAPQGITNPKEGWHAPKGSFISVNLFNVSSDPDIYPDPLTYDAFRHSREREEYEARERKEGEKVDVGEALKHKQKGLVTTGDTHFPFGHGRHACPGRFFVAHEMKMILSHLFRKYEVKRLDKRPATKWLGANIIPAMDARIEVRRRPEVA